MKTKKTNLILIFLLIGLVLFALWFNQGAEFAGADDQAKALIAQIDPSYKPWFEPIWEPPSSEIASLLFSVQAALGSGFICFYLGYKSGQKRKPAEVKSERN